MTDAAEHPSHFTAVPELLPVFQRRQPVAAPELLHEVAGLVVADRFADFADREVGADDQIFGQKPGFPPTHNYAGGVMPSAS